MNWIGTGYAMSLPMLSFVSAICRAFSVLVCPGATGNDGTVAFRPLLVIIIAVLGMFQWGCPSPNTYATPRTVEPGEVAHSTALEVVDFTEEGGGGGGIVNPLVYTMRVGVADRVDLGLRLSAMLSAGADVKWNPIRGPVDVALNPGFQLVPGHSNESPTSGYVHVPLLVGLNFSRSSSLILAPGITRGVGEPWLSSGWEQPSVIADRTFMRLGAGWNQRVTDGFAIQPEVTILKTFASPEITTYTVGLGFNFGALPKF